MLVQIVHSFLSVSNGCGLRLADFSEDALVFAGAIAAR